MFNCTFSFYIHTFMPSDNYWGFVKWKRKLWQRHIHCFLCKGRKKFAKLTMQSLMCIIKLLSKQQTAIKWIIIAWWGAALVQWWERWPSTMGSGFDSRPPASICGLSLLVLYSSLRGFLWVLRFSPLHKTNIWFDLIWFDLISFVLCSVLN